MQQLEPCYVMLAGCLDRAVIAIGRFATATLEFDNQTRNRFSRRPEPLNQVPCRPERRGLYHLPKFITSKV